MSQGYALDFVKEDIRISIQDGQRYCITGTYFFSGERDSARVYPLYYPFPRDSFLTFPDTIAVNGDVVTHAGETHVKRGNGVVFSVRVCPDSLARVTVYYCQKSAAHTGRYILTTTAQWGRPLQRGDFAVYTDSAYTLSYVNYQIDTVADRGGAMEYRFARESFMPGKDIVFVWQKLRP